MELKCHTLEFLESIVILSFFVYGCNPFMTLGSQLIYDIFSQD